MLTSVGNTEVFVGFLWFVENNNINALDGVQVQYSINGTTWVNAGSLITRSDDTVVIANWKYKSIQLPTDATGQSMLYVGFLFQSQAGGNMSMDDVRITEKQQCMTSLSTQVFNQCSDFAQTTVLGTPTRTEYKVMNNLVTDVAYTTKRISDNATTGGNMDTQGDGGSVSVSFIPTTAQYRVTATKPGCPAVAKDDMITVAFVDSTLLLNEGLCLQTGSNILLRNSESGTTYRLMKAGSDVSSEVSGNGSTLDFGTYTDLGIYQLKARKCGSKDFFFGDISMNASNTPVPLSQGFNAATVPDCWVQQHVTGTGQLAYVTSAPFNGTVLPQEGSHFVSMNVATPNTIRLASPNISSTGATYVGVEFYIYTKNDAAFTSGTEGVQVQFSLDGFTWTNAGSFMAAHDASLAAGTGAWKKRLAILPAEATNQPLLYIGLKMQTAAGYALYADAVNFITTPSPLPVLTEYFKGKKTGSTVNLTWKVTCAETSPIITFTVERSKDGRYFQPIHSFDAPSTSCNIPFSFIDAAPLTGSNFYRIRITETNGKAHLTPIVSILNNVSGFRFVSLSPSVVTHAATLNIMAVKTTRIQLVIHDAQGRLVYKLQSLLNEGLNNVHLPISNFAGGTYRVTGFTSDGNVETLLFIKQ